jgi:hypothetical protein
MQTNSNLDIHQNTDEGLTHLGSILIGSGLHWKTELQGLGSAEKNEMVFFWFLLFLCLPGFPLKYFALPPPTNNKRARDGKEDEKGDQLLTQGP